MARDGSGNFLLPAGQPVATGTTISSSVHNTFALDVATALTNSIAKNGETTPSADLPMGTNKHTNVGDAAARNQYAAAKQVQDGAFNYATAAGTNTVTATLSPAITSYAAGMVVTIIPANDNTAGATLALNGLSAITVKKADGDSLTAGDLKASVPAHLVYYSSSFYLLNPQRIVDNQLSSNIPKLDTANTFTSSVQSFENNVPILRFKDADASADEQIWKMLINSGNFELRSYEDDDLTYDLVMNIVRTGKTIDYIDLKGTNIRFNGGDLAVADGGTGASSASAARTNLGLAIGTDVQAWDADLDAIAALAKTDSNFIVGNGSTWVAETGATARTSMGLGTGNSPQFTGIELSHATANTLTGSSGQLLIEGKGVIQHGGSFTSGIITYSTSDPSGGSNGDLWIRYTP